MKFRKKPVEIEAIRWTGNNIDEITEFIDFDSLPDTGEHVGGPGVGHVPTLGTLDIPTLEGTMTAQPGDWIIRGVQGEFYPCKPDVFAQSYEPVGESAKRPDVALTVLDVVRAARELVERALSGDMFAGGVPDELIDAIADPLERLNETGDVQTMGLATDFRIIADDARQALERDERSEA